MGLYEMMMDEEEEDDDLLLLAYGVAAASQSSCPLLRTEATETVRLRAKLPVADHSARRATTAAESVPPHRRSPATTSPPFAFPAATTRPTPHHARPTSAAGMAAKVPASASLKRPLQAQAETADRYRGARKKIAVGIDPKLLECSYCFGTLVPPLFQCRKGHTTCSKCCDASDWESELESQSDSEPDLDLKQEPDLNQVPDPKCPMCHEFETASRRRAMERVLDGLSVPCAFQQRGCSKVMPYAEKPAHEASCTHRRPSCPFTRCAVGYLGKSLCEHMGPGHCPIAGCDGGFLGVGVSLREHVTQWHLELRRTEVWEGCLKPLKLCRTETARVLLFNNESCLLIVDRNEPSGRTLSVLHLKDKRWSTREEEVKYRLEVGRRNSVLSLDGVAKGVDRLTRKYEASASLFVPDAVWDSYKSVVPVSIQLE